jgi:hypothetical protein
MGRAIMIPGMVGKNIAQWIKEGKLPKSVSDFGSKPEEIFVCYDELKEKYGSKMKELPLGAVAMYTATQKLKVGLQQLMAGARRFSVPAIVRDDLMALTREASEVSGIPYVTESYLSKAEKILKE